MLLQPIGRKSYNSNHVLKRLTENWKKTRPYNKNIVVTNFMDLSKAFDSIAHDWRVAKLHAFGFNRSTRLCLSSHLRHRKQGVKINDTESLFQIILSGMPHGSILQCHKNYFKY